MPLQSWNSNNKELRSIIDKWFPGEVRPTNTSVLGLNWNVKRDELSIKSVKFSEQVLSKRSLLSQVSSVFDPLGLISPLVIRGKMLIQRAWAEKLGWDDPLPEDYVEEWQELVGKLVNVDRVKFSRAACRDSPCQLHVFCDASVKAYGAVAYLVSEGQSQIVMSKAKVTPLSSRTLPQLELTAMFVGAQLIRYLSETLKMGWADILLWSDSSISVQWVNNNKSDIIYVRNRVAEIRRVRDRFGVKVK